MRYTELLWERFGVLIEKYQDEDFCDLEIGSFVRVKKDKRNWKVRGNRGQLVLLEWRGPGKDTWPGHEYAIGWRHKSVIVNDETQDNEMQDNEAHDDMFSEVENG
jgi:hypothetical protein